MLSFNSSQIICQHCNMYIARIAYILMSSCLFAACETMFFHGALEFLLVKFPYEGIALPNCNIENKKYTCFNFCFTDPSEPSLGHAQVRGARTRTFWRLWRLPKNREMNENWNPRKWKRSRESTTRWPIVWLRAQRWRMSCETFCFGTFNRDILKERIHSYFFGFKCRRMHRT